MKSIILVGQGPSVKLLEKNIENFRGFNVIWASLNRFMIIEKEILSRINKKFDMVWWSTLNRYEAYFNYLKEAGERGTTLFSNEERGKKLFNFKCKIETSEYAGGAKYSSMFCFLCALIARGYTEFYLIGFDGYAEGVESVYYKQNEMSKTFKDNFISRQKSIARDTDNTNTHFWNYVESNISVKIKDINIYVTRGSRLTCFHQIGMEDMIEKLSIQ